MRREAPILIVPAARGRDFFRRARAEIFSMAYRSLLLAACWLSSGRALRMVVVPMRASRAARAARAQTIALDASIVEGIEAAGGALTELSDEGGLHLYEGMSTFWSDMAYTIAMATLGLAGAYVTAGEEGEPAQQFDDEGFWGAKRTRRRAKPPPRMLPREEDDGFFDDDPW